MIHIFIGRK